MERVIINTLPRSGGTVYLAQYWHGRGYQTFDEPWRDGHKQLGRLHELLVESNKTVERIAVKTHLYHPPPIDFDIRTWHRITFVRRNLLEQTLSYALARDKVSTFNKGIIPDPQLYLKYFKPGAHEHVRWSIDTDIFKRSIHDLVREYKRLLAMPRDEIVFYEECTFKRDNYKQKHKSLTIANRGELEAIWWNQFSTTQPHLSSVGPNS